jgi:hypothetical protein
LVYFFTNSSGHPDHQDIRKVIITRLVFVTDSIITSFSPRKKCFASRNCCWENVRVRDLT